MLKHSKNLQLKHKHKGMVTLDKKIKYIKSTLKKGVIIKMENSDIKWIRKHYGMDFSLLCEQLFPYVLEKKGLLSEVIGKSFAPDKDLFNAIVKNHLIIDFKNYIQDLASAETASQELTNKTDLNNKAQTNNSKTFNIPHYTQANDGKFYKFNLSIGSTYFCPDNTIIVNGEVKTLDKNKCLLFDQFVLDFENKNIIDASSYAGKAVSQDSFVDSVGEFKKIKCLEDKDGITLKLIPEEGDTVKIQVNNRNQMVGYTNPNLREIKDNFLHRNNTLKELSLENATQIGDDFLSGNNTLTKVSLPNAKIIGDDFLPCNDSLTTLSLPSVQEIGRSFMVDNKSLTELSIPNALHVGKCFLSLNDSLTKLISPNLQVIDDEFLYYNTVLQSIFLPNVKQIGDFFMYANKSLTKLSLPNTTAIGDYFLSCNAKLSELSLPKVIQIGNNALGSNRSLTELSLPSVKKIGENFMFENSVLAELYLPSVTKIGDSFLAGNESLTELSLPKAEQIGNAFLLCNNSLTELSIPSVQKLGGMFLAGNNSLTNVSVPEQFRSKIKALKQKGTVKSDLQKTSEEDETENV